jgi:hypothetical protein
MTIWLLAVFLIVAVGALGRQIGGIRMGISLIGVVIALFVAGPLAPHLRSAMGAVGMKDPITTWALAAPLAFLAVMLMFNSFAVGTYIKVSGYYKFRAPDDVRMRWERIDAATGLSLGIIAAVVYLVAASAYVYHAGYVTRQLESPNDNALWLKLVNKVRDDLGSSKFDRVAAGVGQASPAFFQTADLLGLLYHNPELQERLVEYPQFLSLAEDGTFQSVFTNDTFKVLLPAKTNVALILKDPTFRPLLANPEFQRHAQELDLADLIGFLKTGKSEKYAKEPLVGKWQVDLSATVRQYARGNPKATANDQGRLRNLLRAAISDYTLTVTPDEKIFVNGRRDPIAFAGMLTPGFRFPVVQNPDGSDTPPPPKTVATGAWKKEGEKFQFTVQTPGGERTAEVNFVEGGKLAAPVGANMLVFTRAD